MIQGTRSKYYTDIKSDIHAGMPLDKKGNNKIQKVGHDIVRIYFDNQRKDWTIGQERIQRIIYK